MKTIEEYMKFSYRLELIPDPDEGDYVASYPSLKGCLSSGETVENAVRNAEDTRREWIECALENGIDIPEADTDEHYSGQFKLRIPKSLHCQLALFAKREGISMNQYCLYLLSQGNAIRA